MRARLSSPIPNRPRALALGGATAITALFATTALALGCDGNSAPPPTRTELGMNDVTILVPLPAEPRAITLLGIAESGEHAAAPLVSRAVYDRLVATPADIAPKIGGPVAFEDFQVVAVRFDLCDRHNAVPCRADADAVFRLILQPLYTGGGEVRAHDIALHAFYPIPAAEIPGVVAELRALAQLATAAAPASSPASVDAPLAVNTALSSPSTTTAATYRERLRALLLHHVRAERLLRLTVFGQDANSVAFAWILRGLERETFSSGDAALAPIVIPQLGDGAPVTQQSVRLGGGDTIYLAEPVADLPRGFALALSGPTFAEASAEDKRAAVAALIAIQNPSTHDTGNAQCLGCHVATFLTPSRAASAGVDLAALPERFTSSHNLAAGSGVATSDARVLRGLGWAAALPVISQRVANETAQVLAELSLRFPPP